MPKDARLTIRIAETLDAWLARECEREGLDKATFARTLLMRAMHGRQPTEQIAPPPIVPAPPALPHAEITTAVLAAFEAPPQDEEQTPYEAEPAEPTIEEIIAARVADAERRAFEAGRALGLEEADPANVDLGIRVFNQPPPPVYGSTSGRIVRERV